MKSEKNYNFFFNLEKTKAVHGILRNFDLTEINNEIDFLKSCLQRLCKSHYLKLITSLRISFFSF